MSKFVKVKYNDCRYTQKGGQNMWVNIDNIVAFDEVSKTIFCTSGQVFSISKETALKLIEVMKGGEG